MNHTSKLPRTVSSGSNKAGKPAGQNSLGLRASRTVNELLVAEMFLVQATIESAAALEEGIEQARKAWQAGDDLGTVLKRTGQGVFEPYRERYNYFLQMREQGKD